MAWDQRRRTPADYIHPKKQQRVLDHHGRICWLCGHGGANEVDHVIPWAEWTNPTLNVHDESNLRPAHGYPCETCGTSCHAEKTKAEAARGRARGIAQRKAQGLDRASLSKRPQERHPGAT